MQQNFYLSTLYPLQNKVLNAVQSADSNFYLTGGTALSRCYLHHRYSDDLDFFVNDNATFKGQVERIFHQLTENRILFTRVSLDNSFARIEILDNEVLLKVDFVNDVAFRHGSFIKTDIYNKIDSIENILTNKLSALTRQEPKDMADIIFICRYLSFTWQEVISLAQKKDAWVNELDIQRLIAEYDVLLLEPIKWVNPVSLPLLKESMDVIAADIFFKRNNTLYKK